MLNNINYANRCPSFSMAMDVEPERLSDPESRRQFKEVIAVLNQNPDVFVFPSIKNDILGLLGLSKFIPDITVNVKPEDASSYARTKALDKEQRISENVKDLYPKVKITNDTKGERNKMEETRKKMEEWKETHKQEITTRKRLTNNIKSILAE